MLCSICIFYYMYCTLCIEFYAVYVMHCIPSIIFHALSSMNYSLHIIFLWVLFHTLYSLHYYAFYSIYSIYSILFCILCIVFYPLYSLSCLELLTFPASLCCFVFSPRVSCLSAFEWSIFITFVFTLNDRKVWLRQVGYNFILGLVAEHLV